MEGKTVFINPKICNKLKNIRVSGYYLLLLLLPEGNQRPGLTAAAPPLPERETGAEFQSSPPPTR